MAVAESAEPRCAAGGRALAGVVRAMLRSPVQPVAGDAAALRGLVDIFGRPHAGRLARRVGRRAPPLLWAPLARAAAGLVRRARHFRVACAYGASGMALPPRTRITRRRA